MGCTETIAEFLTVRKEDIPPEVLGDAKRHVIDTLGVAIGSMRTPLADTLAVVSGNTATEGECCLWNGRGRCRPLDAAWINGTLAHALDFDDGGVALTPMHPSSPVLPAVWALCEERNLSGRDALAGYILGVEVECKIASAISLSHYDRGWHATSVLGALGAVAGTSWLAGLPQDRIRAAVGICASMAGGLRANFGTMTKPLHAGLAARNGLMATLLAEAGWSAHEDALEAEKGFFEAFACGEAPALENLGKPFHFLSPGVSLKRFPTCSGTHLCVEALLALRQERPIVVDEIETVQCGVHALSYPTLRREASVESPEQARFSLHFAMAMILLEGSIELKHFDSKTLAREDVRRLMQKVRSYVHPELQDPDSKKKSFGQVDLVFRDGSSVSRRASVIRGRPECPLEDSEVDAKFIGCVEEVLDGPRTRQLLGGLNRLESLPQMRGWLGRYLTTRNLQG